jgi:Uma2 family endonuclease
MVAVPLALPAREVGEERFMLHGVSWRDYLVVRILIDSPGLRMTYCGGVLELMRPLGLHEHAKTSIARLVELYSLERAVPMHGSGSTTFRRDAKERGLEPDECYFLGDPEREYPDIAVEVVITSGGMDKLPVYEALGVKELWFWENEAFVLHRLGEHGYTRIEKSVLVPGLDFEVLARFVCEKDQYQAARVFRDWLRATPGT